MTKSKCTIQYLEDDGSVYEDITSFLEMPDGASNVSLVKDSNNG